MNKDLPVVALVGKPNVGKSTLFNRLIKKNKAIVSDQPGTTRDRNKEICSWLGKEFILFDTGGYYKEVDTSIIQKEINLQINYALKQANVILFVVDGKEEINNEDKIILRKLRNLKKPIILVVNKIDNNKERENLGTFYEYGLETVVGISALHGTGSEIVYDELVKKVNWKENYKIESRIKIALFGKQNVGKSTFTNQILKENRVIVSKIPGTY